MLGRNECLKLSANEMANGKWQMANAKMALIAEC